MEDQQESQRPEKRRTSSTAELEADLATFVEEAWSILEPVTTRQWNWHLGLICDYLKLIRDGTFRDTLGPQYEGIIFNVPPRTMKSLLITVMFPVWVWTTDPSRRFMFVSYAEKLSEQHSLLRRNLIRSEWYQGHWRKKFRLARDQNEKNHYENSERGQMFSTAMQATATGMGGDILIFDDPLNPDQALSEKERTTVNFRFDFTFRSRLNDPANGVKIIVMQRLHELDLTGHVLRRDGARWKHVKLPAIAEKDEDVNKPNGDLAQQWKAGELLWPQRLSKSFLDGMKTGMGAWAFAGQYQQNPSPLEGGLLKRNWIRYYKELPEQWDCMVQSWDCTFKASEETDFVAGQVWGKSRGKFYMLPYRMHDRLDFGPTLRAIQSCHAAFPQAHAILIEDKANGPAIISELRQTIPGIVGVDPEGGKLARAQSIAPLWEAGSVELPDPQKYHVPWLEDYINSVCAFPKAAHDDDMDATSQALIYMRFRMHTGMLDFIRGEATAIR